MASDLRMSPWARTAAATRPISISEKYSGAPNFSATSASGGPAMAISSVPKVPAANEPMAAMASAGPGAALPRHLVAVDAGDDGGRLAGQVDQDRGGRAAVLRAVIDAGQHDQRADRRDVEGDRQEHRDGGERADAGQDADQRADRDAEHAVTEVLQREGDAEAEGEIVEQIHRVTSRSEAGRAGRARR